MGKKSVKENKNIYQLSREAKELTRDAASELMQYVSADRIEKIESEKAMPHPDEIMIMSEAYQAPELRNYYCSHECPLGQKYVPEVKVRDLSQLALEVLASLNALEKEKNRLIEITVDGIVREDEKEDFYKIEQELKSLAITAQSLGLWIETARINGKIEA